MLEISCTQAYIYTRFHWWVEHKERKAIYNHWLSYFIITVLMMEIADGFRCANAMWAYTHVCVRDFCIMCNRECIWNNEMLFVNYLSTVTDLHKYINWNWWSLIAWKCVLARSVTCSLFLGCIMSVPAFIERTVSYIGPHCSRCE